jgi:hypothetical protein
MQSQGLLLEHHFLLRGCNLSTQLEPGQGRGGPNGLYQAD